MLHDPSHKPVMPIAEAIELKESEKTVLRRLAERLAIYAADPINRQRAEDWRKLNDLEPIRPLIWINEIPWHEMNYNDELTLQTCHPWAQEEETRLRRELYQWEQSAG